MPICHVIERGLGLVRVTAVGTVSPAEDLACLAAILGDPAHRPGMPILVDHRERWPPATGEQVRAMRDAFAAQADRLGAVRLAVVVSRAVSYGLARMFDQLASGLPVQVAAFGDPGQALAWLRESGPERPLAPS